LRRQGARKQNRSDKRFHKNLYRKLGTG
jgi:hypothetical protein